MKKFLFIIFLFTGVSSFAQVTKADFEASFAATGTSKFSKIFLNNIKTFYTDGTSSVSYSEYDGTLSGFELTNTAILLKYYTDNSKSALSGVTAVPYTSIKYFIAGKENMTILLKD